MTWIKKGNSLINLAVVFEVVLHDNRIFFYLNKDSRSSWIYENPTEAENEFVLIQGIMRSGTTRAIQV